ncbi:1-acyl-sn-glycerol-3-phosphate acyltransferase [Acidiferrimicrobium sp. IK]|uniref:lysophospholipid acyltransferase family protein n=1 Tax=Acidiferrimicrobium sp. IK TaxID=2871700 RepID=UPI0021CB683F|nr:lysophospholipid acyltransferase family protein [Acidiferrimicrobium sp. IK]MCU4184568.1 1-acyl-sn-glycerol-3-phosphate acyltransferase [Acidiferrimicrobium sp. IK]
MAGVPRLPGGAPPEKRLPVSMERVRTGTAPALRAARRLLKPPPSPFPYTSPTWPDSVPREPAERDLGVDYDTDWARRYPARVARLLLTEVVATPAMAALADPQVAGLDRIAHLDGPVVFAANHASHIDTPLLLSVLPEPWRHRTVVAGAADYFFDTKLKAAAFALSINAIPIERLRVSRTSANRAAGLLQDGWSLLIFPEGGRSPDGWGQPHKAGPAWMAVRTGRPIVPIHIEGTRNILPRHSGRIRPGTTHISFGRPIRPVEGDDPREVAARLEAAISALADEHTTDWWTARKRAAAGTSPELTGPGGAGAWRRTWALGERGRRSRRPAGGRWPKL